MRNDRRGEGCTDGRAEATGPAAESDRASRRAEGTGSAEEYGRAPAAGGSRGGEGSGRAEGCRGEGSGRAAESVHAKAIGRAAGSAILRGDSVRAERRPTASDSREQSDRSDRSTASLTPNR
jgi:hypothetical protein